MPRSRGIKASFGGGAFDQPRDLYAEEFPVSTWVGKHVIDPLHKEMVGAHLIKDVPKHLPPPKASDALTFDEAEAAGVDATLRDR